MSHADPKDNACQQGALFHVDCLTVCRNMQYIVYHVMICKTNAWYDIACAHKESCWADYHPCHMFARVCGMEPR